jgi:hypothetical protein
MSEGDLREGLRAAVGDEPPLHFDADELIRRAEHARRRRRALVAVAVATLALTGTVLSLPGVFDRGPGIDAARGPVLTITASPSADQSTAPSTPRAQVAPSTLFAPPPITTRPQDAGTYLMTYLAARFPEVVPEVKVVKVDFTEPYEQDRAGYLTGIVRFQDRVATSAVVVQLSTPLLRLTPEEFCGTTECGKLLPQADGSHLVSTTVTEAETNVTTRTVVHLRADGSVVRVSSYNHDPTTGGDWRPEVAVSTEQLLQLAKDPKLSLW